MKFLNLILFLFYVNMSFSQEIDVKVYQTFESFERDLIKNPKTPRVINFWTTWCKPCIEELPFFMEWKKSSKNKIELVLVSLDREKDLEKRVIPFLKKRNINAKHILLADGKASKWIDKVDPSWSGAIPATLFLKGNKKQFAEKEYHSSKELSDEISAFFNN